ncbi:DUF58 domain-containing protein [Mycolicibacterium sp. S2-37]|uniref:DUF58 domain-containing protein n=1 Tax=Mycolicibacterium sp. S2-37 TaxID=2810297 RepID=UPI001A949328|nr:DUF58 domain-containing protein [Mycolicibacterium sp. S2-37]MBO0679913.1 DUF58 domain-containing protein [Mycolicibacterium sp. S2-37]
MGKHLNRAKAHFGTDTRGLLEGGRYALSHTRSLEFDDLRPYVPGDDVRDIDWKASARSGSVLIKRFVSEKHHKILLIVDGGRNMAALTPSGECRREVAAHILGAIGLISLRRSDEVGMVFGDSRGCVNIPARRGETHIEYALHRWYAHSLDQPGTSDIIAQLEYVATHYGHSRLLVVVSDEPDPGPRLDDALRRLTARHDIMWAMVPDMSPVGGGPEDGDGYDVATGRVVLNAATLGRRVVTAYRRAEQTRVRRLAAALAARSVPYTLIPASSEIRGKLIALTEVLARAG